MSETELLKAENWRRLVVAVVAVSLVVPAAAAPAAAAGATSVSIAPTDASVDVGESTTFEVVVDSAQGGVGAAEIGVTVDGDVAEITDAQVLGSGSQAVNVADDGSSVDIEYAFRDTADSGSVTVAEVTVEGVSDGTTEVSLEAAAGNDGVLIFDEIGTGYDVTGTNGATLSVTGDEPEPEPEPEPANFQVSNLDAPQSATQGDAIDVSAEVTNDGEQEATQTVTFGLDADGDGTLESLDSQNVTLEVDETQTVEFDEIDTSSLGPGDYTHGVSTENDSATATITIEAPEPDPASFQVSNLDAPSSATQGDAIDVSADVTNDGEQGATQTVEFRVDADDDGFGDDGDVVLSQDVQLDPGQSTTVEFTDIGTGSLAPGDYTHGIFSENDSETATLSVTEADEGQEGPPIVGNFENPPADPDDDGLYEDVNGDGEVTIVDVQALFANFDGETIQNNSELFDFNGDGSVDVVDVQKLYNEVPS